MSDMKWLDVESSNIDQVAYDKHRAVLRVKFKHGGVYDYEGVPEPLVARFLSSPSVGSFFHQHIRTRFETRPVRH